MEVMDSAAPGTLSLTSAFPPPAPIRRTWLPRPGQEPAPDHSKVGISGTGNRPRPTQHDLILEHMPLVRRLAAKFLHSGEPPEDLVQVGNMGLIKAAIKYDPDRGFNFSSFAIPVIVGEIKNYFRDHGWAVKIPRKLQTQKRAVDKAAEGLTQILGRSPLISEIAEFTYISVETVRETFELGSMGRPLSLDLELDLGDGGETSALMDYIGGADPDLEFLPESMDLADSLKSLKPAEKTAVFLRFFGG